MSALGLSHPHVAASVGRRRLQIGVAASLSFTALAALIFDSFFGSLSALLFLVAGCLLLATRSAASLQAVLRFWYLLILPGFCLLSILWSQFPGLSFRYGLQFTITVVIAIAIATRISPTTFIRFLFSIYGIGIVGSILFGRIRDDIGAWIGIFGSKNAFAAVICAFTLASIAMLFDRTAPRLMRFAALAGIAAAACGKTERQTEGERRDTAFRHQGTTYRADSAPAMQSHLYLLRYGIEDASEQRSHAARIMFALRAPRCRLAAR